MPAQGQFPDGGSNPRPRRLSIATLEKRERKPHAYAQRKTQQTYKWGQNTTTYHLKHRHKQTPNTDPDPKPKPDPKPDPNRTGGRGRATVREATWASRSRERREGRCWLPFIGCPLLATIRGQPSACCSIYPATQYLWDKSQTLLQIMFSIWDPWHLFQTICERIGFVSNKNIAVIPDKILDKKKTFLN